MSLVLTVMQPFMDSALVPTDSAIERVSAELNSLRKPSALFQPIDLRKRDANNDRQLLLRVDTIV